MRVCGVVIQVLNAGKSKMGGRVRPVTPGARHASEGSSAPRPAKRPSDGAHIGREGALGKGKGRYRAVVGFMRRLRRFCFAQRRKDMKKIVWAVRPVLFRP